MAHAVLWHSGIGQGFDIFMAAKDDTALTQHQHLLPDNPAYVS